MNKPLTRTVAAAALMALLFAGCRHAGPFTPDEEKIIGTTPGAVMRVLTIDNHEDSLFLRRFVQPLTVEHVRSERFAVLCSRMLATVTDPAQDGVGIAAPQVGVGRALVAVMRSDKPGSPFEFYVNPRISSQSPRTRMGKEGCLSIKDCSGLVLRSDTIEVVYNDLVSFEQVTEQVTGFTAVIFQHEIDHLYGRLFTDISGKE